MFFPFYCKFLKEGNIDVRKVQSRSETTDSSRIKAKSIHQIGHIFAILTWASSVSLVLGWGPGSRNPKNL